ncbi:MAG: hypothetical protein JJT81_19870 [Rubellimicrobium sp.]|nr:hypothetical protein [Rubellimicrobium sp.]
MKITRETEDELVLESQPWLVGLFMIVLIVGTFGVGLNMILSEGDWNGLFLMGAGLSTGGLCFAFLVERTQIWADRRSDTLAYRRQTVFRKTEDRVALSSVLAADVESRRSKNGSVNRLTILIKDDAVGKVAIGSVWVSGGGPARAARAINRWLGVETHPSFPFRI